MKERLSDCDLHSDFCALQPSSINACAGEMAEVPGFLFACLFFFLIEGCNPSPFFDNTVLGLIEGAQAAQWREMLKESVCLAQIHSAPKAV